ncbi:MAG TPA: hypothetical protein PL072_01895 [Phycisphaerales bacterium]|nr:hypothetical protein [Phycisphaerales bacterium]
MTPAQKDLVRKFLGEAALALGPFSLLGVDPRRCSAVQIDRALQDRLDQIIEHPEAQSHEADQVRLLLHNASSQLLDPMMRAALAEHFSQIMRDDVASDERTTFDLSEPLPDHLGDTMTLRAIDSDDGAESEPRAGGRSGERAAIPLSPEPAASESDLDRRRRMLDEEWNRRRSEVFQAYEERQSRNRERIAVAVLVVVVLVVVGGFFSALVLLWPRSGGGGAANTTASAPGTPSGAGANPASPAASIGASPAGTQPGTQPGAPAGSSTSADGENSAPASGSPGASPANPTAASVPAAAQPNSATDDAGVPVRSLQVAPRVAYVEIPLVIKRLRDAAKSAAADPAAAQSQLLQARLVLRDHWFAVDPGVNVAATEACVQVIYALASGPARDKELAGAVIDEIASDARRLAERRDPHVSVIPAEEVSRGAWSVGMLARLSRERELAGPLKAACTLALNEALGPGRAAAETTFDSGALAALELMPPAILKNPAARLAGLSGAPAVAGGAPGTDSTVPGVRLAIERWLVCLDALAKPDTLVSERLLVQALESALLNERDPSDDVAVYAAVETLTLRLRWRGSNADGKPAGESTPAPPSNTGSTAETGGLARARLIEWFRDPRITPSDLRVLTSLLASKSGAPGVDSTMVLPINAGEDDRVRLRQLYAQAWGFAATDDRLRLLDQWRAEVKRRVDPPKNGTSVSRDPVLRLYDTVALVRLNQAAYAIFAGEFAQASRLLEQPDPAIPEEYLAGGSRLGSASAPARAGGAARSTGISSMGQRNAGTSDGVWAEKFLTAERSIPLRLEALRQFDQAPRPLSPADAQTLVEAACTGVPFQVQFAAQKLVQQEVNEPEILEGLLQMMPRAPRTRSISEMIEKVTLSRLPAVSDPRWEYEARRAILRRLMGLLASTSAEGWQDDLASRIAEAYLALAEEEGSGGAAAAEDALRGVKAVRARWRQQAERSAFNPSWSMTLDQLDRRADSRRSLAVGPVQAFAAEQTSLVEAMAYVVSAERTSRSRSAAAALDELAQSRRTASHVYEQLYAAERAAARLWLLRLEDPGVTQ